ncbi:hypothetical protein N7493_008931 [Penicillium malachiteum]|uniref:Integrase core domain-containing protein n=1 Tax=Penicillium malachiteum TaxID=1324776 RepID=A0AAD6HFJ1_9EURO|nr:hypothetical protein N7493_008931 [Penicillium malachiteum]
MSPALNFDVYREEISALSFSGHSPQTIRKIFAKHKYSATESAIQRRLYQWGVRQLPDSRSVLQDEAWKTRIKNLVASRLRSNTGRHKDRLQKQKSDDSNPAVPGPNFVWHLGTFRQLERFGIQIYGAVDSYSQYALWLDIGGNACSGASVRCQYLEKVAHVCLQPRVIQTDLSSETRPVVRAHYALRESGPDISYTYRMPRLMIEDCLWYNGGGADNRQMQSWWEQLFKSRLSFWNQYFTSLEEDGLFTGSEQDKITLLAVFMPMIQKELKAYMKEWNEHKSRKTFKKAADVNEQPSVKYFEPHTKKDARSGAAVRDYALPVDPILLEELQRNNTTWKQGEYLPSATLAWCHAKLDILGFNPLNPPPRSSEDNRTGQPYRDIYLSFRQIVDHHHRTREQPKLSLCVKPEDY